MELGSPGAAERLPATVATSDFLGPQERKTPPMALEVSQLTFINDKHRLFITLNIKQLLQPGGILFLYKNNRDIKKPPASQT